MDNNEEFLPPRNVFVTNYNADYDYTDLEKYGQLVYMTRGFLDNARIKSLPALFDKYFRDARPEDLVVLSGPSIVCSLATASWLNHFNGIGMLYMLPMDNKNRKPQYELIEYTLDTVGEL